MSDTPTRDQCDNWCRLAREVGEACDHDTARVSTPTPEPPDAYWRTVDPDRQCMPVLDDYPIAVKVYGRPMRLAIQPDPLCVGDKWMPWWDITTALLACGTLPKESRDV